MRARLAILDDYQNVALTSADWSSLSGLVDITVFNDTIADEDALAERLADFDMLCLMRERTPITRSLLAKLPRLAYIFTSGMRNKSIDLHACVERGIPVTGSPTLDNPTAELTMALMLALARQIPRENDVMHRGGWATAVGRGLKGTTLAIFGLGRMGTQVARLAQAFGMRVIAWSANLTAERCAEAGVELAASKEDMLREADFLSIHVMLGDRTRGAISAPEFALMKSSAYLINTARAEIVDTAALVEALRTRRIAGAGVDVFAVEPLPADDPLRSLDNIILTPHAGYVVEQNYRIFYERAVENIGKWLNGEVVNQLSATTGPKTHPAAAPAN